jgi:hypothetical protein
MLALGRYHVLLVVLEMNIFSNGKVITYHLEHMDVSIIFFFYIFIFLLNAEIFIVKVFN